ncbi:MAG: hypothetical protein AAGK02_06665 [Pseudomonadota bacterium]
MSDQNDQNAAKLIEALVPKLTEALLPQITEHVEAQIGGVVKKSDELLDKLVKQNESNETFQSAAEKALADLADKAGKPAPKFGGNDVVLSREDARDPAKYRQAKADAESRGVKVVFEGRD